MEELVKALENENCNVELYLNQINALNDEEIITLFENTNINEKVKDNILCYASERIRHLSTNNFIKVSSWASNVEEYKKNYFSKIEKMSYEEFVDLIYNGIYEPSILLELVKTDIYKEYLQQEKEEQKENNLQCLDIHAKLDTFSSVEELDAIGKEMLNIINNATEITENIETMEYVYLQTLIENIDFLALDSDAIKIGLELMKIQMKKCQVLTTTMIGFYLCCRIKELRLQSICNRVLISTEESKEENEKSKIFGNFSGKNASLTIFSGYTLGHYSKIKEELGEQATNIYINHDYIRGFSHELFHILMNLKYKKSIENLNGIQYLEKLYTNKELNYFVRNADLLYKLGETEYRKHHNIFIEEIWADIFAIFDSNRQWLTNLKDGVAEDILEVFISENAQMLVSFYTSEDGTMLSPMEKFDAFYLEHIGDEVEPIVTDENPDIMSSLMMGDKIPLDVYAFLQKIANGEIKTIDLYQTLTTYLQNRTELSTNTLENELEEQTPTL